MNEEYVNVAAGNIKVTIADPLENAKEIINELRIMSENGIQIAVFPELCLSGYTCGDLFYQSSLIDEVNNALDYILNETYQIPIVFSIGFPFLYNEKLFNAMIFISNGKILGVIPKTHLNKDEAHYFTPGPMIPEKANLLFQECVFDFGTNLLFKPSDLNGCLISGEIGDDVFALCPPSIAHAANGATLILNASASEEVVGKRDYRNHMLSAHAERIKSGYVYSNAGDGESTQDHVYSGHSLILECGTIISESKPFKNMTVCGSLDTEKAKNERLKNDDFTGNNKGYVIIPFKHKKNKSVVLNNSVLKHPFGDNNSERLDEALAIQAYGLKKRLEHTGTKKAVIGISGGLDSTLALLVTLKTFELMKYPKKDIIGITMPCFGTSNKTLSNSMKIMNAAGITSKEISIKKSVEQHLKDIGHDMNIHDIIYENAQARERTQVLMDIANQENAMVIGTGDLSELILGWCTYNGDHMSMYSVNGGVPKTKVKELVRHWVALENDGELSEVLLDILDTPVSPELLPPGADGKIEQKTEDKIGPYELHDFFLYHVLSYGYGPEKIYNIAVKAFRDEYHSDTILKWLTVFYRRFITQQFKRSCLPDGPQVYSVSVSPRGGLKMPSDASMNVWMREIEKLK